LNAAIERKTFREDLYYRISVIPIVIAPLRDRRDDILPMVSHFLRRERPEGPLPTLDPGVQRILLNYDWPGNVRELENAIRHEMAFSRDDHIRKEDLPVSILERVGDADEPVANVPDLESFRGRSLKAFLREREKEYVRLVIEKMNGDKLKAAQALRVSLATLYRKIPDEDL
jgi:transcriptional regulator with PAS, ATPase and Fis domain